MKEDEGGIGKDFTSIPIMLPEDGKGKDSKKDYTKEALPYVESCLKDNGKENVRPCASGA